MIFLNDLVVGYQGRGLIQPLNGQFESGSLTAIMGANGAGKSTLLKTICHLLPPISGGVRITDQYKTDLSWLPQQADIDKNFPITVFDVVAMGCWPARGICQSLSSQNIDDIYQALNQVGIGNLASYTVNELSGGQFQRMLFARLLVQDAEIMLMDEPFTGIDAQTQDVLLKLICELHEQGKTILTVLHNPDMVRAIFPSSLIITNDHSFWGETKVVLDESALFKQKTHSFLNNEECLA